MKRNPHLYQILCGMLLQLIFITSFAADEEMILTVNSLDDRGDYNPGDGICSVRNPFVFSQECTLRAAIQEVNEHENISTDKPDVVNLGIGRYMLGISGAGEDHALTGDLDIREGVVIRGVSAAETIVDGAGLDRVFHIIGGISDENEVTLEDLTVSGGEALDSSDFLASSGGGVLVRTHGFLRLTRTRVADNKAVIGGGIASIGADKIELSYSEITRNTLVQEGSSFMSMGGALFVQETAADDKTDITIDSSTISNNSCKSPTYASACRGGLFLQRCGDTGALLMSNSTVSNNLGSGLFLGSCNGRIENSTFYGNTGYAININDQSSTAHYVTARNTIFANSGIKDCDLESGDWDFLYMHNLSSDDTCDLSPVVNDKINTDPELYPLGTYGPIPPAIALTHHPRWGAPVIDTGVDTHEDPDGGVKIDQEGFPRPLDGNLNDIESHDMGAIEVLPCVYPYPFDLQVSTQLVTGNLTACNRLSVGNRVDVDGGPVRFSARTSVEMGDRFKVHSGTVFRVVMSRTAGSGY